MAKRRTRGRVENRIIKAKEVLGVDDAGLAAKLGVHRSSVVRMRLKNKVTGAAATLLDRLLSEAANQSAQAGVA